MIVTKTAILLCLTVASAVAVGQNNSSPSANNVKGAAIHNAADLKGNRSNQDESGSDCDKKKTKDKDKDKNKHDRKPTPSKQEQEFEKMLQGIYG